MSSNDGQVTANNALASNGGDIDTAPPPAPADAKPEKPKTDWWRELRAIALLILAVLCFHSLVAKPFYIPSESMMPGLLKGDRLVVSKYPYGWSWVSPTFHILPRWQGRLFGSLPERGDVVIATHPVDGTDYIKRVIGLPGDTLQMDAGLLSINGTPIRRERMADAMIRLDANIDCPAFSDFGPTRVTGDDGLAYCRLPIFRETMPNGASFDTIDLTRSAEGDDFGPITIPDGHVFLMGDNRDQSADSRFPADEQWKGLGGSIPWENVGGRAEFITFSLDGSSSYWNPISWFTALRGGRAGTSLHPEQAGQ